MTVISTCSKCGKHSINLKYSCIECRNGFCSLKEGVKIKEIKNNHYFLCLKCEAKKFEKLNGENLKELQKLAQKIQLEIKEEEFLPYLETFKYLEKLLAEFQKVQIGRVKPLVRINVGHLTLKDLSRLKKKFSQVRVSPKDQAKNSLTTADGFVLFKK